MTKIICTICPKGCNLNVFLENNEYKVVGNSCVRGEKYGIKEINNPERIITSTVRVINSNHRRLPVISDKEIPKNMMFDVMKEINKVVIKAPIKLGDIVIKNVLNTDVNIIASRSLK